MRRTYISPEFKTNNVYGTYNMVEESNFFGAKMLEIEDSILIDSKNIIYYQKLNGEQLDFDTETTLESNIYSSSEDKKSNHKITIDESQSKYNLDNNTKWIIDIDIKKILSNYLYAELKRYRTFEGIKADMVIYNNVNVAIKKYIEFNVLNRYKLSNIEFYVNYTDLRSQNVLRYKNIWNENTYKPEYKLSKVQTISDYNQNKLRVLFNQEKPSSTYKFDYFFNLLFVKI
jgi:hypothetical protein